MKPDLSDSNPLAPSTTLSQINGQLVLSWRYLGPLTIQEVNLGHRNLFRRWEVWGGTLAQCSTNSVLLPCLKKPQKIGLFHNLPPFTQPTPTRLLSRNGNCTDWLSQAYDLIVTSWKRNIIQGSLDWRKEESLLWFILQISAREAKQRAALH